ncbi:hypothetical protein WJX77_005766 [Trebouxia sp. C0004]
MFCCKTCYWLSRTFEGLGDAAGRTPKQLSARAQKQLQQLRADRNKPHYAQTTTTDDISAISVETQSSSDVDAAALPTSTSLSGRGQTDRLPTKAELLGTLGTVNRKVYEQVTQSRNRLSTKLSAANKHIRQLQKSAESHSNEITAMTDSLHTMLDELTTLSRIADTAAASVQFGTERQDTAAKMSKLVNRMHVLQQVVKDQTGKLDQLTERRILVVWFGIAQEVRLMGDFDNWTQGFSLSAEEFSDGTFTQFQSDIKLVPGRYQVKFLVDKQWRTAPDWPTVQSQHGTNNVLQVD